VLSEAGGVLRGLRGGPAGPQMVVAAGESLCATLAGLLADLDADSDADGGTESS
jgi:hypothetical protein